MNHGLPHLNSLTMFLKRNFTNGIAWFSGSNTMLFEQMCILPFSTIGFSGFAIE